jgi:hypothetical protein
VRCPAALLTHKMAAITSRAGPAGGVGPAGQGETRRWHARHRAPPSRLVLALLQICCLGCRVLTLCWWVNVVAVGCVYRVCIAQVTRLALCMML